MRKEDYYDYQIEFIEKNEYESLDDGDREKLLEIRRLSRRRKQHQLWVDKHQNIYDEYIRREKLIKEMEKDEKDVFDDISLLKKRIIPQISIYTKDESSKSLKNTISHYRRKTYKGKPLQKRERYYCTVRMRTSLVRNQKNIYLGSKEKLETVLNTYLDESRISRSEKVLKNKVGLMLMDFFVPHLKEGWEEFTSKSYSFEKVIIPWLTKNKK